MTTQKRRSILDVKRHPKAYRATVTTYTDATMINVYGLPESVEPFTVCKPTGWGAYCVAMRYLHKRGICRQRIDWTHITVSTPLPQERC